MVNLDVDDSRNFDGSEKGTEPVDAKPEVAKDPEEQPKAAVQTVVTRPVAVSVEADERGLFRGNNLDAEWRLATAYARSGLMPAALCTPEKVLVALQLCRELNLPPMTSIGKIMVLNGTPSIFGDLPLALVRRSGRLRGIVETWIKNETGETIGAKCWAARKDTDEELERSFTVEDAKVAGLWNKKSASGKPTPWVLYPNRMMQMRARAWALKDLFGDVLSGVSIAEYDMHAVVEGGEVIGAESGQSVADKLNAAYLEPSKTEEG